MKKEEVKKAIEEMWFPNGISDDMKGLIRGCLIDDLDLRNT